MGTPVFARVVLQQLILEDFKIVGLVTQPSKPFGRHYTPKDSATKSFILENHPHIPILEPAKIDEGLASHRQVKPTNDRGCGLWQDFTPSFARPCALFKLTRLDLTPV